MTAAARPTQVGDLVVRNAQVLSVGAVVLVLSALAFLRVPLLPYLGHDLSMSAAELGLITTVFAVGRLCQRQVDRAAILHRRRPIHRRSHQGMPESHPLVDRQQPVLLRGFSGRRRDPEPLSRAP